MDVTCIGDVNVDILTSNIKTYPKKDTQLLIEDLTMTTGGCAANTSKALAVLGAKTRLIAKAGNDVFGDCVRKDLAKVRNLDLHLSKGKRTGVTLAVTFEDKMRSFLTYTGGNGEFSIKDVDLGAIKGKCLHTTSFFLLGLRGNTNRILDYAHEKGMITTFDPGFDPRGWKKKDVAQIRKTLRDVDIFFPNLSEAEAITGKKGKDKIVDALLSMGVGIVALKMGCKGSYVCTKQERTFVPPFKIKNVVDTTGAGDVYAAGFIYAYLKAWDLQECARFASAAAALKTRGFGSSKYPRYKEVEAML